MSTPIPASFAGVRRILVADEDPLVVAMVIQTMRQEGHAAFYAYDGPSAVQMAFSLDRCDLVITDTRVDGMAGVDLIRDLRARLPALPIMYIAKKGRSTPEMEAQLPADVPILREPFTTEELRASVRALLLGERGAALDTGGQGRD